MKEFRQYDVVRIVRFLSKLNVQETNESSFKRPPEIGDIATVVEVYTDPPGYELECCEDNDGVTTWLASFTKESIELEKFISDLQLTISHNEAIVLFEFLSRFSETDILGIKHPSEEKVLWRVLSTLEKSLVEPFSQNYDQILASARKSLIDG